MTRRLLNFEIAILSEAGVSGGFDMASRHQVLREWHAPPYVKSEQWFNTDFWIEINEYSIRTKTKTKGPPIRPWSMAGQFYVVLTMDGVPLTLELLEGESLPSSSFIEEIGRVEVALERLRKIPRPILAEAEPYLRVARLDACVPFVVCTTTSIVDLVSAPAVNLKSAPHRISYRQVGEHFLIDGVLYD
jgi:hypothetical protein